MKSSIAILFVLLCIQNPITKAQNIDTLFSNQYIGAELARIAWENSNSKKGIEMDRGILQSDLNAARFSWLDALSFGANINEFTINPPPDRNVFYPRYNFAFRVSYGTFAGISSGVKKTKIQIERLNFQKEADSLQLRAAVLRGYENYKLNEEMLKIAEERTISVNAELRAVEDEFTQGSTDLDTYNKMLEIFNDSRLNQVRARHSFVIAKINLEELIGMPLEDVMAQIE